MFFRTFGYQGSLTFTMYPAVWMRDLPLLQLGHKSYFGDGILFGTNQISSDQKHIKVGKIEVGEYTIFDQQCSIGLNTFISDNCQFGFRNSIGLRCQIGRDVRVREMSSIGNCVKIGDGAQLGQNCIIHDFTVIEPGTKIDDGMRIPKFSIVSNDGIKPRRLASTKLILQ
ncbi:MAG: hypothetical protein EOO88_62845 [Pedobacter sp.]|nr:MAG: hypothetical protein EOO88_62845 [Pedobacter sp.]